MNLGKILDLSIKQAETNGSKKDKFYVMGERRYENYLDNETWKTFVDEMRTKYPTAFGEYEKGSGDELGIKKEGRFPPKMASYGSSSRMIYLLSRDIKGFCFEKKLPTTVGGIANIDGYLHSKGTHFYVEAKCREPYSSKSNVIDRKYENLYRFLDSDKDTDLKCSISVLDEKKMEVRFSAGKKELTCFDIKQMISHLLGIATDKLLHPTKEKTVFLYLLYDPSKIEIANPDHRSKIISVYEKETAECKSIPFKDIYKAVTAYLFFQKGVCAVNEAEAMDSAENFSFFLCNQTSYISLLK